MSFNATADPWVAYLLEDGTTQSRLITAAICFRSLVAMLGMVCNAAIVYITYANKSLHGICNILIAAESLLAIPMDAGFHVSTFLFLSGIKFITFRTCFPMLFCLDNLPGNLAQIAMVLTGFDRLLSIAFPIWYKTRKRWHCFLCISILLALYGLFLTIVFFTDFGVRNQMTLVGCTSDDNFQGGLGPVMTIVGLTWSGTLMATYSLIFILAFVLRPIAKTIKDTNLRLIKSLVVIIGIQLFGVFFRLFMKLMFNTVWNVDIFFKKFYGIFSSITVIIVYSLNAPVLYVFSEEYRKIFNKHFPWLKSIFTHLNANAPQQQSIATAQQQQLNVIVVNRNSTLVNNFASSTSTP